MIEYAYTHHRTIKGDDMGKNDSASSTNEYVQDAMLQAMRISPITEEMRASIELRGD